MKKHLFFLSLLFLSGCGGEQTVIPVLVETDNPALHAVKGERLKILMHQLDDLMYERMLDEVQIDRQRRYHTEEIAKVAEQLLNTVEYIPNALPDLSLVKQQQQIFLNLSEELKQQVKLLKHEAEANHVDAIPKRINQIIDTCNACHHVFRKKPEL